MMKTAFLIALALLFSACSEETTTSTTQKEMTKKVNEVTEVIVAKTNTAVEKVAEVTKQVAQKAKEIAPKVTEQVKEVTKKTVDTIQENVAKVTKSVQPEVKKEVVATKVVVPEKPAVDGAMLFKACAGCHGSHGERKAMGKSQIIKGWDVAKVTHALNGYKDGSYGGAMKGIMKGQATKLDDAKIEAIGKYLSKQ